MTSARPASVAQASTEALPVHKELPRKSQPRRLEPSLLPLQSIENNSSTTRDYILDPPSSGFQRPSSTKTSSRETGTSHSGQDKLGFVPITAPTPPMFTTDSPTKKAPLNANSHPTSSSAPISSMPQSALFTTFSSVNPEGSSPNENRIVNDLPNDNFADFPEPSYGNKAPLRRTLLEAAPLKERLIKKSPKSEDTSALRLPEPEEMPPIEDDGTKPPYSYATLIGMSILRATNRRLTLAQIYKWISDTFSYYKNSDPGWQNSIRHNLSLNKAFIKQERPKDDPGKGNYWAIEPGMEAQFLKDKPLRRATMSSLPLPAAPQRESACQPQNSSSMASWVVPPPPSYPPPQKLSSKNVDLSSDATLPASDPALQDDTGDEGTNATALRTHPPRSSPPQPIHSSPPVAPPRFSRQGTPPSPSQTAASSAAGPRSKKRKSAPMNDSGYFSSLESSAMRPNKTGHILTSDLDIEPPRIKRGRAEEEIARIRSSSHDISPNHSSRTKDSGVAAGSSPIRGDYVSMLPPPLTPVIKFKKPAKPPPSVSPNTNLRNHRRRIQQMVNSPIKHLGLTDEDLPWSPAFNIQDEAFTPNDNFHSTFDVFADSGVDNISTPARGSPEKRSAKRARLEGGGSGGNALADITSMSVNSRMGASSLSSQKSKGLFDSPSKMPDPGRFIDATHDDFFSFHLFDESPGEVDGVDLLQGFQKIGGASKEEPSKTRTHISRPNFTSRSNTSLF